MLRAFVAQSILHALVAGLVVEALLRAWRVEDAAWRLRFRLARRLPLPILVLPGSSCSSPWRASPVLRRHLARSSPPSAGTCWASGGLGAWGSHPAALAAGAGFRRSSCATRCRRSSTCSAAPPRRGPDLAVPDRLSEMVDAHARALGIEPPAVRAPPRSPPDPALRGRPAAGAGPLGRHARAARSGRSLDAAVAHEMAHAAHRDPAWGYALIAARALTFFNPATQWTARAVVDDLERRADQVAAAAHGEAGGARPLHRAPVARGAAVWRGHRRPVRAALLAEPRGRRAPEVRSARDAAGTRGPRSRAGAAGGDGRRPRRATVLCRMRLTVHGLRLTVQHAGRVTRP